MPITNDAGIAQVSPGAGAVDLTRPAEGYPDSPERYRPSGEVDLRAGGARRQQGAGAPWPSGRRSRECATSASSSAIRPSAGSRRRSSSRTRMRWAWSRARGRCGRGDAGRQRTRVRAADAGAWDQSVRGAACAPGAAPAQRLPAGGFTREFEKRFGREPGPYAAYGYEAMQLVLAAIAEAEGEEEFRRGGRRRGARTPSDPTSVLGELLDHPRGRHDALPRAAVRGPRRRPIASPSRG